MATMRLCSWLLVAMLMSLTMCEVRDLPRRSALGGDMITVNAEASLQQSREGINQREMAIESSKRGCDGFPCMYTHLGDKAGQQALQQARLEMLSECAHNPECSPGKRRRRSAPAQAILSLRTRDERTTS